MILAQLRFALILLFVLAFALIGLPLDALAKARGWTLRQQLPLFFHRVLVRLLNIRVETTGEIAPGPALIIPNHVSWTDISIVGALNPLCFVAKKEVASWPVFGALAKAQGSVFVNRARRMDVRRVNAEMALRLNEGRRVVLFPEGTTGDGQRLLKFHTSHFAAAREALRQNPALDHVAVQPVSITYLRRHGMVMERKGRAAVAWYGDAALLPHLWDLLNNGPLNVRLTFAEPLAYRRDTDRKALSRLLAVCIRQNNYAALYNRGGLVLAGDKASPAPQPLLINAKTP